MKLQLENLTPFKSGKGKHIVYRVLQDGAQVFKGPPIECYRVLYRLERECVEDTGLPAQTIGYGPNGSGESYARVFGTKEKRLRDFLDFKTVFHGPDLVSYRYGLKTALEHAWAALVKARNGTDPAAIEECKRRRDELLQTDKLLNEMLLQPPAPPPKPRKTVWGDAKTPRW